MHAFVGNLRAAIIVQPRGFGERCEHIQLRQCGSRLLDFRQLAQHFLAHALENSYSSFTLRSSAPRILPSISFNSGVMKRSPLATVCLR